MTENLKLQNKTLSSSDSDLPASAIFTVPASGENEFCTTSNSANCDGRANVLDTGNASYGVYYNWFAATAGEGTYSKSSGNVSRSICPKGWRLPTGGSNGEFQGLYNVGYNTMAKMQSTDGTIGPGFVLSGHRDGGSTNSQGGAGRYWSSTAYNNYSAQRLELGSSGVIPAGSDYKYLGFTARCISR